MPGGEADGGAPVGPGGDARGDGDEEHEVGLHAEEREVGEHPELEGEER